MVATAPPRYRRSVRGWASPDAETGVSQGGWAGVGAKRIAKRSGAVLENAQTQQAESLSCWRLLLLLLFFISIIFYISPPVSIFHASAAALASRDSCFIAECLWLRFCFGLREAVYLEVRSSGGNRSSGTRYMYMHLGRSTCNSYNRVQ